MKILLTFIASIFTTVISFGQTFTYNGLNYNVNGPIVEVGLNPSASGTIVIPDTVTYLGTTYSVTSIRDSAFSSCANLTSITIPNSVTSIQFCAFNECTSLISLTIPNSVTTIGAHAFRFCSNLTSITLPNSVISIGGGAFLSCESLTSITLPNSLSSIGPNTFSNCTALTSIILPNSITSIGNGAFSYCTSLTSISIPNSVTSIGVGAFSNCTSLTSITLPNSITSIEQITFSGCNSLTSITIPNSVTSIGNYAFQYCYAFTAVTIPNSVTSIGVGVFSYDTALTSITLPNSITSIQGSTFSECNSLTSITIPNSVTSIGNYAFLNCSAFTSVTIPNSVTSIGASAFSGCTSLTLITLPNSVTSIGNDVFQNCTALTSIIVPNSVTSIGVGAFSNCISLTSITLSNSLTSIEQITFSGCNSLTSITIPNSVTNIGNYAFQFCSALTSITIPNSVTSIGFGAFTSDTALTSITIPNSLTSIQGATFFGCNSLTSITIPNSVTSIGDNAFSNCTALTSITIPNSVTSIGDNAFSHCTELTSLTIPNSVTSIGIQAFYSCSSLASIILPNSLTSIGDYAFSYNNALTLVVLEIPSPLSITSSVFQGQTLGNIGLCVPIGSLSAYQGALIWQDFNPISEGVNVIPMFDPVPPYCSGATIPPLPTTSNNGVTGTWSPAINSLSTTLYTFTPTNGCAIATMLIQVDATTGIDNVIACDSFTWIDGITYTSSNSSATFTLTNASGCDSVVTLNLIIKNASLTNTGVATTSACLGTLEATMIGGTAPYSYTFNSNPPQDSSTLNNACAGFNYVTITDSIGCTAVASYFLPYDTSSQPLTAYILVTTTSQTGLCDGEVDIFVTGGTAPYTFVHSTGGTSSLASGLCEGLYSVTVTDVLGTTIDIPYMVAADTNTLFIYQDDTSNAYNTTPTGSIENCNIDYSVIDSVTVASVTSFAVDSVTVIWNVYSGGGALEVIPVNYYIGFGLGYYNFILDVYCPTKSNGKFLKVTAKVNVSSLVSIDEEVNFITGVYPNPFTGSLTILLSKENQYTLSLYDISGRVLYSKKYDNTKLIELSELDYLAKGEFLLHIQSAEGVLVRKVVK